MKCNIIFEKLKIFIFRDEDANDDEEDISALIRKQSP